MPVFEEVYTRQQETNESDNSALTDEVSSGQAIEKVPEVTTSEAILHSKENCNFVSEKVAGATTADMVSTDVQLGSSLETCSVENRKKINLVENMKVLQPVIQRIEIKIGEQKKVLSVSRFL